MVSIGQYGKLDIQDCEWESDLGRRALIQGIVHSTSAVMSRAFHMANAQRPGDKQHGEDKTPGSQNQLQSRQSIVIRQLQSRVVATIAKFVGLERDKCHLRPLKDGERVQDLTRVKCYVESLREHCPCAYCSADPSSLDECAVDWFEYYFSTVAAKIIVISLFAMTETVRLFIGGNRLPWDSPESGMLIARVGKILFPETRFLTSLFGGDLAKHELSIRNGYWIPISEIFHLALSMIGHDVPLHRLHSGRWIASAQRGQVVYPHLLESRYLNPHNILLLGGGPGALRHDGEGYSLVMGSDPTLTRMHAPQTAVHEQHVVRLMNLMQSGRAEWSVCLTSHDARGWKIHTHISNR
jgi:hypothetical protein